ncbi:hypothetical protein, conserved [Trypanosoma brucei gambiense DAL972]|uniref:Exocyst complex component EXOC6/Sec15 N-terminal domain-containing protein n=1 Tax=Trypanosoma brucei gambiense (strain MHOM/CI/86/DAL972) TaxID=679716 RepID=D0A7N6_TRYB9|nr:hypothetical protein, conserved [Trypanosoma brucei gambiense DAL972]CBH17687.1 hypothetical protein, conserved [Trypanosoma brucei gambiense DAL972]|eukprot:XP_011779951.1 hypothetical protein, conserved [Trypanosoma brucei gambiense DAL972]
MGRIEDLERNERLQVILRSMDDSPHLVYHTEGPLRIHRHGRKKKVLLAATPFYLYLLKVKGMRFYARWPNIRLTASLRDNVLLIESDTNFEETENGAGGAVVNGKNASGDDFRSVMLFGTAFVDLREVEQRLMELTRDARLRAEQLAKDEIQSVNMRESYADEKAVTSKDPDSGESEEEEEEEEEDGGPVWGQGQQQRAALSRQRDGEQSSLFQKAPSRYLAVTSIVDGEFTDYSTLKNAYIRNEEDVLLEDIATFINENKGQVEKLCERHYPVFLQAARQCTSISEDDAKLVGQELSGAIELVRSSAMDMKVAAAELTLSRRVKDNVARVRLLLHGALEVAEHLETTEARLRQQQLLGAVVSLKQLLQMATPLIEYTLGDYVINQRVPQIAHEIFTCAIQHLNAWLKLLREMSLPIGTAAMTWRGTVDPGSVEKELHMTDEGEWWVELSCTSAFIRRAPFAEAEGISKVLRGAAMQEVFEELRCGAYYRNYYIDCRAQQAKLDLYDTPLRTEGVSGKALVEDLNTYCATALGFILIEDIVYHVTDPHMQSTAEVLCMWDQISHAIAERARCVTSALANDPDYTEHVVDVFRLLRRFVNIAVDSVVSVRLSPVIVSRMLEVMSDSIISTWLQEACVEASQIVSNDTLQPISVGTDEEYNAYVKRFSFDRYKDIELFIPSCDLSAGEVVLPYALLVPKIGETALRFLARCHSIIEVNNGAVARQSEFNNVDEMLLKYLSVLFRTVAGVMQGHLASVEGNAMMKLAVYVTSCAVMPIILSCVEQQFVLAWPGDYGGLHRRKKLGEPQLLDSSSSLFAKEVQNGIGRLLPSFMREVEERLKPTADVNHWKRLVAVRQGTVSHSVESGVGTVFSGDEVNEENGGLIAAMDFIIGTIPKLLAVLQVSVTRSVLSTVITQAAITAQMNIEQAIHAGIGDGGSSDLTELRACVKEFEQICATHIPQWKQRIAASISEMTVAHRFPLNPTQIADDLLAWIANKEAALKRTL